MAVEYRCCELEFFIHILIIVLLVLFAGLMSGLTLGLMSMSLVDLEVIAKSGKSQDRKHAEKILPVVKNQHLLLCTLLICNAAAMEALPIFLDSLVSAWGAILISVTLILLFGEIKYELTCHKPDLSSLMQNRWMMLHEVLGCLASLLWDNIKWNVAASPYPPKKATGGTCLVDNMISPILYTPF